MGLYVHLLALLNTILPLQQYNISILELYNSHRETFSDPVFFSSTIHTTRTAIIGGHLIKTFWLNMEYGPMSASLRLAVTCMSMKQQAAGALTWLFSRWLSGLISECCRPGTSASGQCRSGSPSTQASYEIIYSSISLLSQKAYHLLKSLQCTFTSKWGDSESCKLLSCYRRSRTC